VSEGPLSSGEGIIYALRDASDECDKKTGDLLDPGASDKRLLVTEAELASTFKVMRRDGSLVSTILRSAWDGGVISPLTKNFRICASNPHLNIIGHITSDELTDVLTTTDIRNGLANRFLWCLARRTKLVSRPLPMDGERVRSLAQRIAAALHHASGGPMAWSASALEEWDRIYPTLTAERPGAWGYATARAEAQVIRLAMIYALLDGRLTIDPDHLAAALAAWRYCDESARYLFEERAADPIGNRILIALEKRGGELTQTDLHAALGRNADAATIISALTALQESGLVTQSERKTSGRSAVVWRLTRTPTPHR
jgi:hypothetical protein